MVKIYTTNSTDDSLIIPSYLGALIVKSTALGGSYLSGVNDAPTESYGKLTNNGFITGSDAEPLGNKLNVIYYYEAIL